MSERRNTVGVFFTLADKDGSVRILRDFGQAIKHALFFTERPNPAAVAVRLPLPEVFRIVPNHLIQERTAFVGVVVFRDDLAFRLACAFVMTLAVRLERTEAGLFANVVLA